MASEQQVTPSVHQVDVARVYARAALGLAEEQGVSESLREEIDQLMLFLDAEPRREGFLGSPLVDREERREVLDKLFRGRMSELLLDSLQVMNQKGRASLLRAFAVAYRREHDELRGVIDVRVRTAVPLTDDLRRQLADAVNRLGGKTARLDEKVEPSLIGGMVLHMGDEKIDDSVAQDLKGLRRRLEERASREIQSGKSYITAGGEQKED